MASISRSSAFISSALRRRPARTLVWQASVPATSSSRSFSDSAIAGLGDVVGEIAHQALDVGLAQHRGHLAHHHGVGAERLDDEAEFGEFVGARRDALDLGRIEFDDFGNQQRLARDAAARQRASSCVS